MCLCGEASERAIYLESVRGRGGHAREARRRVGRVGARCRTGSVKVEIVIFREIMRWSRGV